ncbi:MAG: aminoacyl-tRNA hydrolase [Anaerolineae bacterium]|nr:aminoacyl-tRNA hydrolase [Anaerolineae bacterium]
MIQITPTLALDEREIHEAFVRAVGPGGQNVNKVATAVQLRFDVAHSPSLPDEVRTRLMTLARSRITDDGVLIITARQFRTQAQNRRAALNLLIDLIRQATQRPKPHLKTKPTLASKQRRLESKRRQSAIKQARRRVSGLED